MKKLAALVLMFLPLAAFADAIVRNEAMLASTIAEIFIDEKSVRLELEFGRNDLQAFKNLLPDEIYTELGYTGAGYEERLDAFLTEQWRVLADGKPLSGQLVQIGPAKRVRRDNITGEPLPTEGEAENVVAAEFVWPLGSPPDKIDFLLAVPAASVGYVVYHKSIAVNDFRYLGAVQTLHLDWDDPWYSRFESRSLRRWYFASMAGFIYVEPYEVRKEVIVRLKDLQRWVDLGLEGAKTISVEMQPEVTRKALEFLASHQPVTIDGAAVQPSLTRANFLERTLKTSRVIDPPQDLDIDNAILGTISIYPHEGFANKVTMEWDLFDERVERVPSASVDPTGALPILLEPHFPMLEWENFIRIPVMPTLVQLESPPSALSSWLYPLRWPTTILSLLAIGMLLFRFAKGTGVRAMGGTVAVLSVFIAVSAWWLGGQAKLDEETARNVVTGLLTNIYRGFDFRNEEQTYDMLARSVNGELLRRVYLEMRGGLVLASQGGATARVKEVELIEFVGKPAEGRDVRAEATWRVRAAVGHWGHLHERRNEYRANLQMRPIDGAWKLVSVEILDEVRL